MRIQLFTILLLLSASVFAQVDCEKFKVGKFQNIEDGEVKSTIERNDSIQVERFGNKEIKLEITWINDCSYQLHLLDGNEAFWESRPKDMATPDLIVRIIETDGNAYLQEARLVTEEEYKYKSRIEKIE